jgi:hypothetical protein
MLLAVRVNWSAVVVLVMEKKYLYCVQPKAGISESE